MDKLLTPQEISDLLGVQKSTIYQWTHIGFIPHIKLGKFVRFKSDEIDKWVEEKKEVGRASKKIRIEDLF